MIVLNKTDCIIWSDLNVKTIYNHEYAKFVAGVYKNRINLQIHWDSAFF